MRRATAVRHLVEMAEVASEDLRLREATFGWPLVSLWVTGELLGGADDLEVGSVIVVLDLPADEVPWLALHPTGEWVGSRLGLGKRPLLWCYRPAAWPAWNAQHQRVLQFWSDESGLDDEAIDGLRHRRRFPVIEPTPEELLTQLRTERAMSARHLYEVLDRYHDRNWRREHKGFGGYPEDHLWRAAQGLREIDDALAGRP